MKLIDFVCLSIIALCLFSLAGCKDNSEPLPFVASPVQLRNWTPDEECALANALRPIPADSILWTLESDWARMRRDIGVKPVKKNANCRTTTTGAHFIS